MRTGRTSTSRTTTSALSNPADMRPPVHQPTPKSQTLPADRPNHRLPASVKWPWIEHRDVLKILGDTSIVEDWIQSRHLVNYGETWWS